MDGTFEKWTGPRQEGGGRIVFSWRMMKDHRFHRLFMETRVRRSLMDVLLRRTGQRTIICGIEVAADIGLNDSVANLVIGSDGLPYTDHMDDVPEWSIPVSNATLRKVRLTPSSP